ncbi:rhamnan synthesis F family protein [Hydrogenophaga sp.]|uniref:rhamnan synthesis F family protein n=1 Tax=Hydrogenophaga sp. TaxID=1904254 RepID=UPI00263212EF|nr:rhamnan synthesis F family protein [Hydrogenophaga sp.]MCW5653765.1 hypothetical protein [Hydrogenophaga sp.]
MIPRWKIEREFETFKQQLQALPERLIGPARQRRLDARFPADYRVLNGAAARTPKVAIFLIYQPRGMAGSVLATCQHLARHGYAVMLVANSPVSAQDQQTLGPYVWRFVERPNFGYDFGGYRDGIRLLWHWSVSPEQLIILNDSVWFPLAQNESMIDAMEASSAGFLGALRYVEPGQPEGEHAGIFLSYFFLLKRPVLTADVFLDYWNRYVSTSNKYLTVRRGERGFSRTLFAAQVPSEGIYSRERMLALLATQGDDALAKTLDYGAYTDGNLQRESEELLRASPRDAAWRERVMAHIGAASARRNFHSTFCYATIGLMGVPLLKKNRGELQVRMRRQYVRAVLAGDLPRPDEATFAEIRASVD